MSVETEVTPEVRTPPDRRRDGGPQHGEFDKWAHWLGRFTYAEREYDLWAHHGHVAAVRGPVKDAADAGNLPPDVVFCEARRRAAVEGLEIHETPLRVVTLRMPSYAHAALRARSKLSEESINQICLKAVLRELVRAAI